MSKFLIFILSLLLVQVNYGQEFYLPVKTNDRHSISNINLTNIGKFGLLRKARPKIPAHYHTGIDIKRPSNNYQIESVFPIIEGMVISKREEGPYSQLIIEHRLKNIKFWTVYEHIIDICVKIGDIVDPQMKIARFMNKYELNKYGWQFDHVHFEILKVKPVKIKVNPSNPERCFMSYTLICYDENLLHKYFHNPITFFRKVFNK